MVKNFNSSILAKSGPYWMGNSQILRISHFGDTLAHLCVKADSPKVILI
jgi:hypothetical protein